MRGQTEGTNEYPHEHRFLEWAKEIRANHKLSKEELSLEYGKLADEYEAVLTKLHLKGHPWGTISPAEILETESRLFAGISHEFRTPLTLLITALEDMYSTCGSDGPKRKLSMMLRNAQRLFFIIKQVLALSEIEKNALKIKTDLHDLISFLKGIMASFELWAQQNEVELVFETEKPNIILYLDPGKMAEAMCNLLMNALRYTPAGGRIKVSVSQPSPEAVVISVRDTGPGIPRDRLESIFDRYYHLRKPYEPQKKGFGVGLFLVREYIVLHGGTIRVNSVEAEGTEFVIRLPVEKDYLKPVETGGPPVPAGKETVGGDIAAHHTFMQQLEREEAHQMSEELIDIETGCQGREIVLVVEDNRDMLALIIALLKKYYSVVAAENGREGINIAKKMIPDIIISDIIMPEVDGIELCRVLKKDIDTSHIPIILLTARAGEKDVIWGLEAGADDYITKPFHVEVMLTRVKNLLDLRRRLQEKIERRMRLQPEEISLSELEKRFLDKIQTLIEENLSDPDFGVDRLAAALDNSRPTLYRKIMALTGQPPNKFIQAYRLKRSVDLLKSHYGNITEVAFKVGFSSSAYFSKCFKDTFQRSPSDFQPF